MLHGLPNHYGWVGSTHRARDWTDGCIAVTNEEIDEIWRAVPDGTPIEIRPSHPQSTNLRGRRLYLPPLMT
jgi:murein L,D-transpeptidase YafK